MAILSDIKGVNNHWLSFYTGTLKNFFSEIVIYDSRELAAISEDVDIATTHKNFINGGIDRAVNNLVAYNTEYEVMLGFSIGGLIAWKAAVRTVKAKHVFAVSSTRLRLETCKPAAAVHVYFGEKDEYKPPKNWFSALQINENILHNEAHEFYIKENKAGQICTAIKNCIKI